MQDKQKIHTIAQNVSPEQFIQREVERSRHLKTLYGLLKIATDLKVQYPEFDVEVDLRTGKITLEPRPSGPNWL